MAGSQLFLFCFKEAGRRNSTRQTQAHLAKNRFVICNLLSAAFWVVGTHPISISVAENCHTETGLGLERLRLAPLVPSTWGASQVTFLERNCGVGGGLVSLGPRAGPRLQSQLCRTKGTGISLIRSRNEF